MSSSGGRHRKLTMISGATRPCGITSDVSRAAWHPRPSQRSRVDATRGKIDRRHVPSGRREPQRFRAMPATCVECPPRRKPGRFRNQVCIRRPPRHLVGVIAQRLRPELFPIRAVLGHVRQVTAGTTVSSGSASTLRATATNRSCVSASAWNGPASPRDGRRVLSQDLPRPLRSGRSRRACRESCPVRHGSAPAVLHRECSGRSSPGPGSANASDAQCRGIPDRLLPDRA